MLESAQSTEAETEFVTFGPVHLDIVDKDRSVAWWRDVVGLELIGEDGDAAELGIDGDALVVLRATASTHAHRGYSGLYHLAINLPDEVAFAQTLARLISIRARLGATDHVVAKSIYLADPDGIGLELTVELPERVKSISWPPTEQHPEIVDAEGRSRQGLEDLDVDAVLAKLPGGDLPRALPRGTRVGHVHLKVADLDASFAFYRDRLGLIPNNYVPVIGYADLGTGDFRLHRVAVNTWTGVGLPPRPPEMAGMRHYTMRADSMHRLQEMVVGLEDPEQVEFGFLARDPAGNAFKLELSTAS